MVQVVREAGTGAENREKVIHDFLKLKRPACAAAPAADCSALGAYSINSDGDTSLAAFTFSRLRDGTLVPLAAAQ